MPGNRRFDSRRFRELIIYLTERSAEDIWFGATKLNKALYYCDFIAYQRLGKSITGATYQKLTEGPAPKELLREREILVDSAAISLEERPVFNYVQQRIVPNRQADWSIFDPKELQVIDEVLRVLGPMTAREVSDMSHAEVGWAAAEFGEKIPYETAFLTSEPIPAELEMELRARSPRRPR